MRCGERECVSRYLTGLVLNVFGGSFCRMLCRWVVLMVLVFRSWFLYKFRYVVCFDFVVLCVLISLCYVLISLCYVFWFRYVLISLCNCVNFVMFWFRYVMCFDFVMLCVLISSTNLVCILRWIQGDIYRVVVYFLLDNSPASEN